ncbi:MAG TPA: Clp protease N-terminal domain-containing protein [Candidatus Dormibacteraeota bacterium]
MYPFERFTHTAKKVLTLAQEEAEQYHHSYIGTEHLLLGLLRARDGVAAIALHSLGIELGPVRETIATVLGRNERILVQSIIPTSRVKKVIEIAFQEAQREQQPHVGTAQLLTALVIEGEGIAAHVLQDLGAGRKQITAAIHAAIAAGADEGEDSPLGSSVATAPLGTGARVLVHDPEPPYRLWEGRVTGSGPRSLEVEVPDRPAGARMSVDPMQVHPIPTGPTVMCKYCLHHL